MQQPQNLNLLSAVHLKRKKEKEIMIVLNAAANLEYEMWPFIDGGAGGCDGRCEEVIWPFL